MRRSVNFPFLVSLVAVLMLATPSLAQVGSIKSASKAGGSSRGERGSFGGGGYFFFNMLTNGVYHWQRATLSRREEIPSIVSLDVFGQVAVQPSRYYVFNPRIRGNWGIFLTDFRMNYMVEHGINGVEDLRTDDWQIIGLNLVNERNVTVRISTGFLHENFGDNKMYNESVVGLNLRSDNEYLGLVGELRWARDFGMATDPRKEVNLSFQTKLFESKRTRTYGTLGGVYQRYYSDIDVWGFQAGFAFKLY